MACQTWLTNLGREERPHSRIADRKSVEGAGDPVTAGHAMDVETRQVPRPKRRSASPRAPPGGSYRIPEKGQIQIVIKNQNKTAVKLFLVPYDLEGMEPGTKTFIRQRSYSGGPIIDGIPNHGGVGTVERPTLRYLVHLHICCPAKGRFYLYKSIRLVFANRVPDGKEKLRNETTWPEPRFSPYKPIRVMHPPLSTSNGPGAMLAAEKAFRRRSSGFTMGGGPPPLSLDMVDGMFARSSSMGGASSSGLGISNVLPLEPIPLRLPGVRRGTAAPAARSARARRPSSARRSPPRPAARPPRTRPALIHGAWRRRRPTRSSARATSATAGTSSARLGHGPRVGVPRVFFPSASVSGCQARRGRAGV
uniref:Atos-like C-terminal domain-containing protein n=1 Tax=Bionectria ochroleuca TaxID=29856 RepID=A0A8H7TU00_BIOOC